MPYFEQFRFDTHIATAYHCAPMSSTPSTSVLPRHIDPRKFAQQGLSINGEVTLSALERLVPLLASVRGEVQSDLDFSVDEQGIRVVDGVIDAKLELVCQRCLGACEQSLSLPIRLGIVWNDEQAARLTKARDPWLLADEGQTDIYQMIEEELILGLPIVAYHESDCVASSLYQAGEIEETGKTGQATNLVENETTNPFQALQSLKETLQSKADKKKPDSTS